MQIVIYKNTFIKIGVSIDPHNLNVSFTNKITIAVITIVTLKNAAFPFFTLSVDSNNTINDSNNPNNETAPGIKFGNKAKIAKITVNHPMINIDSFKRP